MEEADLIIEESKKKMQKTLESLKQVLAQVRSGRAAPAMVEDIKADVYGQMMPLNQLATISIPEPRQILIDVWDKSSVESVEKAIQASGRNLNPQADGGVIRIHLPELTQENRKDLVKVVNQKAEEYKVSIRNIRRDDNLSLKKIKEGISEDLMHDYQEKIQKMTDENIRAIANIQKSKEEEIMKV